MWIRKLALPLVFVVGVYISEVLWTRTFGCLAVIEIVVVEIVVAIPGTKVTLAVVLHVSENVLSLSQRESCKTAQKDHNDRHHR